MVRYPEHKCVAAAQDRRGTAQAGSALTEFVLLVPLFVAMIYGTIFLSDLAQVKLKAQEIARYMAWGMASRPLTNLEDNGFNHQDYFQQARESVGNETAGLYANFDSTQDIFVPGVDQNYFALDAVFVPNESTSIRNRQTQLMPEFADVEFTSGFNILTIILSTLGIGNNTNDLVANMYKRMDLNTNGLIEARADVFTFYPDELQRQERIRALEQAGELRGANLAGLGRSTLPIRDAGRPLQVSLLADPWKVPSGVAAVPWGTYGGGIPAYHNGYLNAVKSASSGKAIEALPLGSILSTIFKLSEAIPSQVAAFVGQPNPAFTALVSRPYVGRTQFRRNNLTQVNRARPGQVDIFAETGAKSRFIEKDTVRTHETGPLFLDPDDPTGNGYYESIQERGRNFMGCPEDQERWCFSR